MGSVGDRRFLLRFVDACAALNISSIFCRPMIVADSVGRGANKSCNHSKSGQRSAKAASPQETSYLPALMNIFFHASEQIV